MTEIRKDDDLLVTEVIKRRLRAEALFDAGGNEDGPGHWWCCMTRTGNMMVQFKSSPLLLPPSPDQVLFAHDMCWALNRHLHHDGKWIVEFTHPILPPLSVTAYPHSPYERWVFIWIDKDGDPQFSVDNDGYFIETLLAGPDHWMEQAEQAWMRWRHHMRDVFGNKRIEQITYKRAQGEQAPVRH